MLWIGKLLAPFALKLMAGAAILAAVAGALLYVRNAGKQAERAANLSTAARVKDAQLRAANRPPGSNELDDILRRGRF